MLDQNERTWRNRYLASSGAGGRVVERHDDVDGGTSADGSSPTSDGETDSTSCPICGFASAEYDDVYVHLMTAHRKSTVSAALLGP